jgi:ribosomal protein S6--L-glutamate ligase
MRFHFLLQRRVPDVPSKIVVDVTAELERRGHRVVHSICEEELLRLDRVQIDADLYLLKSYSQLALEYAGVLDDAGASLINNYCACALSRNKIVGAQILARAGIPSPDTWTASDRNLLKSLLKDGPIILKPHMGWRGEGVQIIRTAAELDRADLSCAPLIAQRFVENIGNEDLRLYVAGEHVFATRKPFSRTSFSVPGRAVPVSDELRDLALRTGRAFGLTLFGLDIIESRQGPVVIDVNYFPGYLGVPAAQVAVADVIEEAAGRGVMIEPLQTAMRLARVAQ